MLEGGFGFSWRGLSLDSMSEERPTNGSTSTGWSSYRSFWVVISDQLFFLATIPIIRWWFKIRYVLFLHKEALIGIVGQDSKESNNLRVISLFFTYLFLVSLFFVRVIYIDFTHKTHFIQDHQKHVFRFENYNTKYVPPRKCDACQHLHSQYAGDGAEMTSSERTFESGIGLSPVTFVIKHYALYYIETSLWKVLLCTTVDGAEIPLTSWYGKYRIVYKDL